MTMKVDLKSNINRIVGMCEALLDACGVKIDHALASTQLEKAELSCERCRYTMKYAAS